MYVATKILKGLIKVIFIKSVKTNAINSLILHEFFIMNLLVTVI